MINVRRVGTLLRGFVVWCTILHALQGDGRNAVALVAGVQSALVNEKWQGENEQMEIIRLMSQPRRNGLRQVRIPRKSDFNDMMERRKHSWVRPMKPADKFLNNLLMIYPPSDELLQIMEGLSNEISNVISSDEDVLRTVLWWYSAYPISLAHKLQVRWIYILIFFSS